MRCTNITVTVTVTATLRVVVVVVVVRPSQLKMTMTSGWLMNCYGVSGSRWLMMPIWTELEGKCTPSYTYAYTHCSVLN